MITFKAIIIPNNKRKDGTYPVKIRVTFKGVTRRLPTTLVCKPTDITRGNRIKNQDILSKTDEIINQMRAVVRDISPFNLEAWTVDNVVRYIQKSLSGADFRLDFFAWADTVIRTKTGTARQQYENAVRSFGRFLERDRLDINDISRGMVNDFIAYVEAQPKMYYNRKMKEVMESKASKIPYAMSSMHIKRLSQIFELAKLKYNDEDEGVILIPKSPFSKLEIGRPIHRGQKNLGVELMQQIISAEETRRPIRIALDAFIVSFGLMGVNLADMYAAEPFNGDVWTYNRAKTKGRRMDRAEMRVRVPDELRPYLDRLQQHPGKWWLPTLHKFGAEKETCAKNINRSLSKWCEANEVPAFTFYAARHTWASLARKAGVEKSLIDECLAHIGEFRLTDIYAERNWDLIQEANRKVLNLFKWK